MVRDFDDRTMLVLALVENLQRANLNPLEEARGYKPELAHFRRFAEKTGVTRADWIHVANSWMLDILPSARLGLRCVWVERDLTGHPAKLADRRVTSMRRLPEAVSDVNAIPPRAQ